MGMDNLKLEVLDMDTDFVHHPELHYQLVISVFGMHQATDIDQALRQVGHAIPQH